MFPVNWKPLAVDGLAWVCVKHPDRWADIDVAEHDISYRLQKDPRRYSHESSEGFRRIISSPLVVCFSIHEEVVYVEGVAWLE